MKKARERRNSRDLPSVCQAVRCICKMENNFEAEMIQNILGNSN